MVYRIDTPGVENLAIENSKIGTGAVSTQKVDASINNALVPIKGIIMYSGLQADIPANWSICDGNNGTPNLVNKFVIAAASYDATVTPTGNDSGWRTAVEGSDEASGGEATKLLGTANLPSHTHTITDPGHDHHSFKLGNSGESQQNSTLTSTNHPASGTGAGNLNEAYNIVSKTQEPDVGLTSSESTGITQTDDQGGTMGQAFDILPPYYAIAYIMRVS